MTGSRVTIQQAALNLGRPVVYVPQHGQPEAGVVSSVTGSFVFVRYGSNPDAPGKATRPQDLVWETDFGLKSVPGPIDLSTPLRTMGAK